MRGIFAREVKFLAHNAVMIVTAGGEPECSVMKKITISTSKNTGGMHVDLLIKHGNDLLYHPKSNDS